MLACAGRTDERRLAAVLTSEKIAYFTLVASLAGSPYLVSLYQEPTTDGEDPDAVERQSEN